MKNVGSAFENNRNGIDQMALLVNESMRMALQESDPDSGIQKLIRYLGETLEGGRVYIFELFEKEHEWKNTYEWCRANVEPEIENLQHIPYDAVSMWLKEFSDGNFVVIRDLEASRETDPVAYEYLAPQDIHSIITGPLYNEGTLVGFYGIDNPPVEKINEVAEMIRTISHVIETMLSKRNLARQLEFMSYHDQMLKLGNRHAVDRYLKGVDHKKSFGVVFCDVCGLKRINDTFGHAAGDALLLSSCECLKNALEGFELFRIGGDEMLALISGYTKEAFDESCHRLRELMFEKEVPMAVGTVWSPFVEDDPQLLIATADGKMYEDKVQFYKNTGLSRWHSREQWFGTSTRYDEIVECVHSGLEKAIADGQFVVYYQPQYNYRDYSLTGAEALVRWIHPERGMIAPGKFIPYLEQNGMISKLDEFVMRETCRKQKEWKEAGLRTVPISVNLSRRDLESEEICYRVRDTVLEYGLSVEDINLEVTESAYMEQPESVIGVVCKFQEMGFKVEMDDFGSGYSSLNSLKEIPVDILKMDMKFVAGETIHDRDGKILSAVIRMAHWIGMPVIAEGVETQEQARFLSNIGCFYMQGFFFDKALPVAEFENRLTNARPDLTRDSRMTARSNLPLDYFSMDGPVSIMLDSALGAAGIIEYDGQFLDLVRSNTALYDMFGFSQNNQKDDSYKRVFYKENADSYVEAIKKAIETMDRSECETQTVSLKDPETPFWTRTRFKYLRGYDGVYTLLITVENIDQFRKLQEVNGQLYRILDQMEKNGAFGSQILKCEPDGRMRITYFNRMTPVLLGYEATEYEQLVGENALAVLEPGDREEFVRNMKQSFADHNHIMNCNIHYRCKNGGTKLCTVIGIVSEFFDGPSVIRILFIPLNVAEASVALHYADKKESVQKLAAESTLSVPDVVAGPFVRCSFRDLRIMDMSHAFCRMLGYDYDEHRRIRYDLLSNYVTKEDVPKLREAVSELAESGASEQTIELTLKNRSGVTQWALATLHKVEFDDRSRVLYLTFEQTEQGEYEAGCLANMYRNIAGNEKVGILLFKIIGKRWSVSHMSTGYLRMLGYSAERMEQLTSNDILALVHPKEREFVRENGIRMAKEGRGYGLHYRMLNASGEYMWLLSYCKFSVYRGELYLCMINYDVAEIQRMSENKEFRIFPIECRDPNRNSMD